ncbi:MAG: DNA-directed RNA polymerase subunit beta' [Acholeplasmatales bacterium]|nr:DNA-directed RNA polymerase subunit beta' [Acholeplasmatales bacterium]
MKIRLASPNEIRIWSYGVVKNHETIHYRTGKPVREGLFAEEIFGPIKDYKCACGNKNLPHGTVCEKCHVEITSKNVRRERMGRIELSAKIVHPWYAKSSNVLPSLLSVFGKNTKKITRYDIDQIINLRQFVVTDPGTVTGLLKNNFIDERIFSDLSTVFGDSFVAITGAEAIEYMLSSIDLKKEINHLKHHLSAIQKKITSREGKVQPNVDKRVNSIWKKLQLLEDFYSSDNKLSWMVTDVIPVLPPDLRPIVALDGGKLATNGINNLYRDIINRNNRLEILKRYQSPSMLINNERRQLQNAIQKLYLGEDPQPGTTKKSRPTKSLSEILKGKQGRFRQNLLGKRVDYSARSVIIVGPDLKMYQCGIPREMAVILFKPFILQKLRENVTDAKGNERTIYKDLNKKYEMMKHDVWEALEEVVKEHPVLLNRAPTLHRLGIQAFEPKLIDGKAIRLHPLVCSAFNADFDGDQMAVHLPLSIEAQAEARLLMLASNNILKPSDGKPIVTPSQDMVIGNYYLTMEIPANLQSLKTYLGRGVIEANIEKYLYENRNEGRIFADFEEVEFAFEAKEIGLHTRILIAASSITSHLADYQRSSLLITTYGKLLFNQILPNNLYYLQEPEVKNLQSGVRDVFFYKKEDYAKLTIKEKLDSLPIVSPFDKKFLSHIISQIFKQFGNSETATMLDKLKDLGFMYSTVSGLSISAFDVNVYSGKEELLKVSEDVVAKIENQYDLGLLSKGEKNQKTNAVWKDLTEEIKNALMKEFKFDNPVFMMSNSGARGTSSNFSQLIGMRGLMNNPKGDIIEVPVKSSFREGLTVSEFFISTHGARKGSTDTALKTAESGYLTRRLVDVSQDVIVTEEDCGSDKGFIMKELNYGKTSVPLVDRIIGRYVASDVLHPETKEVLVARNTLIDQDLADVITNAGVLEVEVRSILTCNSKHGVCVKCYGQNLATNKPIEVGEAVGVIAAQSIGEPGTQLTMRTFHTGGVASTSDITQGLPRVQELLESREPKGAAVVSEFDGKITNIEQYRNKMKITIDSKDEKKQKNDYSIDNNKNIIVKKGDEVQAGQALTDGPISPKLKLKYGSILDAQTYILEEVKKVYKAQDVDISDKHIEIIIRQMSKFVRIVSAGDSNLLPGTEVSIPEYKKVIESCLQNGQVPPFANRTIKGIGIAARHSDSFLSAVSFQYTIMHFIEATNKGKTDELFGLKENAIVGDLIPCGTGLLSASEITYLTPSKENISLPKKDAKDFK